MKVLSDPGVGRFLAWQPGFPCPGGGPRGPGSSGCSCGRAAARLSRCCVGAVGAVVDVPWAHARGSAGAGYFFLIFSPLLPTTK